MGTITLPSAGTNGQPNDVTPVNSNFSTVETVINGNLDDANIQELSPSKLLPEGGVEGDLLVLTSGTWTPTKQIATTVLGLGTPVDGRQAAVLAGGTDVVSLIYSATLLKWESPTTTILTSGSQSTDSQDGTYQGAAYSIPGSTSTDRVSVGYQTWKIFDDAGLEPYFQCYVAGQRNSDGPSIFGQITVTGADNGGVTLFPGTNEICQVELTGVVPRTLVVDVGNSPWEVVNQITTPVKDIMYIGTQIKGTLNDGNPYEITARMKWRSK